MSTIETLRQGELPAWGSRLVYGGDYNPEQWPREVWADDVRLMREARVNTVTVGVFAWSSLEPREGEYTFEWLDEVMDLMAANGIHVVLATPTASPPPWMSLAYPDALPVTREGVRLMHGSRDTYNPASADYRRLARRITRALAERYGDHPALAMWHLHNEYGTVSYGPVTDAAFRIWLRERYGDLETLNHTWNSGFWSQGYGAWDEIHAPQATQYLPNPVHALDFKRFSADQLLECLIEQAEIVRAVSPGVPVTTNFMLPTWNHIDQWDFAAELDVVSIDHYPSARDIEGETHVSFGADLARSFNGGRPWVLMEQATSLIYDYAQARLFAKEPGRLARNTVQYLAKGATGSLFFQWRSPRTGAEFFHSPMVPHAGEDSRVFREIVDLGRLLEQLGELAEPATDVRVNENRVAIVWDADSWWSVETRALPSDDLAFLPAVRAAHRGLWWEGINADVVRLDADLSGYDVVLVPSKFAASDAEADALTEFAENGGHVAFWYTAGSTDENLSVRLGGFSGAFASLAGIRVEEHHPLAPDETVALTDGSVGEAWSEDVQLRGAESIADYASGPLAGRPAITRNDVGDGVVHYLSTRLSAGDLRRHLARIAEAAGITRDHPDAGHGLEAVRRVGAHGTHLFLINHTDSPRTLDVSGEDVLTGTRLAGATTIPPHGWLVVREETEARAPRA
ncbi:beta-galactosidase [Agromyces atrinae]|uniref:beta-galactosidase n=1 Tax=Agromyces atrinae TaxID=592376 RepID=UPI001F58B334|nr:beta-galactosidase [Agromyces atrinae]MCI2957617.1 beta-galactosidase [Agromyces atrinae]